MFFRFHYIRQDILDLIFYELIWPSPDLQYSYTVWKSIVKIKIFIFYYLYLNRKKTRGDTKKSKKCVLTDYSLFSLCTLTYQLTDDLKSFSDMQILLLKMVQITFFINVANT